MGLSIEERVISVVVEHFGDEDPITRELYFVKDLGADSLDSTELIMELEEEFSIDISDAVAEKILTVGQAVDYVSSVPIDS
jgi:acyl carrier protein